MGTADAASTHNQPEGADNPRDRPARVVAVTAARVGTAKRGLATGIARTLARLDDTRVCIIDADVAARDVGTRFGIDGPTTADVDRALAAAESDDPLAVLARDGSNGCWVVPSGGASERFDRSLHSRLVERLRTHFDYLVIDAPVALAMYGSRLDPLIDQVDELLIGTTTQPEDVPALVDYLNAITRGRVTSEVPPGLEVRVVPTGDNYDPGTSAPLERKVRSVAISGVLPRLWGRHATLLDAHAEAVPETLATLVQQLADHRPD